MPRKSGSRRVVSGELSSLTLSFDPFSTFEMSSMFSRWMTSVPGVEVDSKENPCIWNKLTWASDWISYATRQKSDKPTPLGLVLVSKLTIRWPCSFMVCFCFKIQIYVFKGNAACVCVDGFKCAECSFAKCIIHIDGCTTTRRNETVSLVLWWSEITVTIL